MHESAILTSRKIKDKERDKNSTEILCTTYANEKIEIDTKKLNKLCTIKKHFVLQLIIQFYNHGFSHIQ